MKVIIAGSRHIRPMDTDIEHVVDASGFDVTEVVCGEAPGVDQAGAEWANLYDIPVHYFPAHWDFHGRSAGPIRNRQMAEAADALILIWDGKSRGSASMKREAETRNLPVHEVLVEGERP